MRVFTLPFIFYVCLCSPYLRDLTNQQVKVQPKFSIKILRNLLQILFLIFSEVTPWTQDVNRTYIRRSEDVQDVFWTSYVRSIYVLCPGAGGEGGGRGVDKIGSSTENCDSSFKISLQLTVQIDIFSLKIVIRTFLVLFTCKKG